VAQAVLSPPPAPVDSDGDGIDDGEDRCPQTPEDIDDFEDDDGCPEVDNDQDGIDDVDDACPLRAEIVNGIDDQDGCPDEGIITMVEDRIVLGEKVLFDKNRARVKRKGREALRAIIALYLQHPEWGAMSVEGHADSRGPADFNMSLSRRRADRVRHAMIDLGMPADKITSKGLGETVPLVEGKSEEAMQTNRRVEFVIRNIHKEVRARIIEPGATPP
jgi:outer membrane protein OmpA-like peptidoglycan-associated protein